MVDLEEQLVQDLREGGEASLERALLIASGLQTEEEVTAYTKKLNRIQEGFRDYKKEKAGDRKLSQKETAKLNNPQIVFNVVLGLEQKKITEHAIEVIKMIIADKDIQFILY